MKEIIRTDMAPPAAGPGAQAVRVGSLLLVSGQLPLDPATGEQFFGTLRRQVDRVVANLKAVCEAAGAGLADVAMLTVYVADLGNLLEIEEALERHFADSPPARSILEVSRLPKDAGIMIDAVVSLE